MHISFLKKYIFIKPFGVLVLILLLLALLVGVFSKGSETSRKYKLAKVRRGDLLVSVSATGTVEPEEVIDVGAQVAGRIVSFGKDRDGKTIDYGSVVEEGTILATIDDSLYAADVAQAEAELKRAQADVAQLRAKQTQAEADWQRASKLGPSEALSQSSYDSYRASYEVAKANVSVGEAAVVQAQAALGKAQRNLSYCVIKSPVNGVIIDRRVNIGQTVVSSLNAPSLFLLAKDLKRMQVWVAVNEADIGSIHPGQVVRFGVDAYPGERFEGVVGKVRLNATMTQNVVTYTVEVVTDNSNGRLLPYLTANAQFEVSNKTNVLLIPNVAMRWKPAMSLIDPQYRARFEENKSTKVSGLGGKSPEQTQEATNSASVERGQKALVWQIGSNEWLQPLDLLVGASDGSFSEVLAGELKENQEIISGEDEDSKTKAASSNTNPFTPQMPRPPR